MKYIKKYEDIDNFTARYYDNFDDEIPNVSDQMFESPEYRGNFYENHYWLVPTRPIEKFKIALKKIGFEERNIEEWLNLMKERNKKETDDKVYIIHVEDADGFIVNDYWDLESAEHFIPNKNDFYEGEIEVSDTEVEIEKYNL